MATNYQISVTTSLAVLAVYTVTLHMSVPGGDSGMQSCPVNHFYLCMVLASDTWHNDSSAASVQCLGSE